eukprot:NODE_4037_length_501_cov_31.272124_g3446_i0.p2 GENE.NODE_4037_length_501_cov_31.272124_g3446_i0~~NODE_4037_length_501_cov_31.272124_g3446_i0.p2  ORF type:complete len:62 (+),score=5.96 NODE_4037_length_501_cov_31.272124_g3446_i0:125-310(+)
MQNAVQHLKSLEQHTEKGAKKTCAYVNPHWSCPPFVGNLNVFDPIQSHLLIWLQCHFKTLG